MTDTNSAVDNPDKPGKLSGSDDGLLKASSVTGSMTMISRILGLVRDVAIARIFEKVGFEACLFKDATLCRFRWMMSIGLRPVDSRIND